ncbi:unnamed protein product, partial [Meganyctiphanes norvegica]
NNLVSSSMGLSTIDLVENVASVLIPHSGQLFHPVEEAESEMMEEARYTITKVGDVDAGLLGKTNGTIAVTYDIADSIKEVGDGMQALAQMIAPYVFWTGVYFILTAIGIFIYRQTTLTSNRRSISPFSSKAGYEQLGETADMSSPVVDILWMLEKAFSQYDVPRVACEAHAGHNGTKPQQ